MWLIEWFVGAVFVILAVVLILIHTFALGVGVGTIGNSAGEEITKMSRKKVFEGYGVANDSRWIPSDGLEGNFFLYWGEFFYKKSYLPSCKKYRITIEEIEDEK